MNKHKASEYIRANFRDSDRIAVVLIRKRSNEIQQRVGSAHNIASEPFQAWLRYQNKEKFEVYVSMNALRDEAHGRKKSDIGQIRHVYLDFDKDGPAAIEALSRRKDVPTPSHILESSPGKYQVVWRVENFDKERAEKLMRGMVRELGADPAATDSSRVLRVPGFYNHKYERPHLVTVQNLSDETYRPSHFPEFKTEDSHQRFVHERSSTRQEGSEFSAGTSQSERDWAFALRALGRGDEPSCVSQAIEAHRPDKPNPSYYAEHTVAKALAALNRSNLARVGGTEERTRCDTCKNDLGQRQNQGVSG